MLLRIRNVLSAEKLAEIRAVLAKAEFVDGKTTAGYRARRVKDNLQIRSDSPERKELVPMITEALMAAPDFTSSTWPKRIGGMLFSRYVPGMRYGPHVDNAIMSKSNPLRTDVAFTVFLSSPDEYEGGELVIAAPFANQRVKLAAGEAVVYPASTLHQVVEVTRGERLVAVGWVQSHVRSPEQRQILFDLERLKRALDEMLPEAPETDLVFKTQANLMRMWAEN